MIVLSWRNYGPFADRMVTHRQTTGPARWVVTVQIGDHVDVIRSPEPIPLRALHETIMSSVHEQIAATPPALNGKPVRASVTFKRL